MIIIFWKKQAKEQINYQNIFFAEKDKLISTIIEEIEIINN